MAKTEIILGEAGGANAEWLTPTYSNGNMTVSTSWNYDADTIVILFTASSTKYVFLSDINSNIWYSGSGSSGYWHSGGTDSRITATSRTFSMTFSTALSDVSICPIAKKPTGYFS